jgi:hypothetical protein
MQQDPCRALAVKKKVRPGLPPSSRNCAIYEQIRLEGESHEQVAVEHGITRQRVGGIVARVESWIATHAKHPLAQKMRLRCGKRWDTLWARALEGFERSRQNREVKKQRTARRSAGGGADGDSDSDAEIIITEKTVREQNGDPRFLIVAWRVAEREDKLWIPPQNSALPVPPAQAVRLADAATNRCEHHLSVGTALEPSAEARAGQRFLYLPAGLGDLAWLARGGRSATEAVECDESDGTSETNGAPVGACRDTAPVSRIFEQRCAEAFRCLGFDVRQLGQGCGRVADCLAVAAAERFAVVIDAKVRRKGYTLGTDDRQFCEYATRHSRELAQAGIERVYFAVVGQGFRQADLDKLAGFMTGTPIRSVLFIEAEALMRLVDDSIRRRREFRLAEIDQLLFGNKIIGA